MNLPEHLLPWWRQGVEFIYAPGGLSVHCADASNDQSAAIPKRPQRSATPAQAEQECPTPAAKVVAPDLPEPWAAWFAKLCPTARVVFTYADLALDLTGQGGDGARLRGALFRNVLKHLRWPKGTTAFWPMGEAGESGLVPNPVHFWAGVQALGVRHVACFGLEAAQTICPDAQPGQALCTYGSAKVYILGDPDDLARRLPHEQHMAAEELRRIRL